MESNKQQAQAPDTYDAELRGFEALRAEAEAAGIEQDVVLGKESDFFKKFAPPAQA